MLVAFALAIFLALLHFFSEEYGRHAEKFHVQLVSFSSGLFLGIIFLYLLPEFFKGEAHLEGRIYLLMLGGFVLFHLGEKYVYQHIKHRKELMQDLKALHAIGFFVDHFVVGITLFLAFSIEGSVSGFLIFVPLLLHTLSSSISLNHIDSHFKRLSVSGIMLPLAPACGVLFAYFLNLEQALYYGLFSFVVGALLYVAVRDMLPREQGKPAFFLTGVLVSVAAVMLISLL